MQDGKRYKGYLNYYLPQTPDQVKTLHFEQKTQQEVDKLIKTTKARASHYVGEMVVRDFSPIQTEFNGRC